MKLTYGSLAKMLLKILILVGLLSDFVLAADPLDVELKDCKKKVGWQFCTPELELNQAVQAMRTRGSCCQKVAISSYSDLGRTKCTPSDDPLKGIQCTETLTEDLEPAYEALYDSYSLGMLYDRTVACPTLEGQDPLDAYLTVSGERTTLGMATQLREDKALKIAESCYWVLRPERDTWITDVSSLEI